MITPKYDLKFGTLAEVAKGEGSTVKNYDLVHNSCEGKLIVTPADIKVVGVYENRDWFYDSIKKREEREIKEMKKDLSAKTGISQESILHISTLDKEGIAEYCLKGDQHIIDCLYALTRKIDSLPINLISLVYDHEIFSREIIEEMIKQANPFNRIAIVDYSHIPNFEERQVDDLEKRFVSPEIISSKDKKEKERVCGKLETRLEHMAANRERYGATLVDIADEKFAREIAKLIAQNF